MFETFILAVVMVMVLIAGMSIGVIFGRKPISGSCGGVGNQLGGGSGCSVCGRESGNCGDDEETPEVDEAERLTYSADSDRKA